MPRGKQGTKAGRAERNRAFQDGLRARKRLRRARREGESRLIKGPAQILSRPLDPRDGNEWNELGTAEGGTFTVSHGSGVSDPVPFNAPGGVVQAAFDQAIDRSFAGPFRAPDVRTDRGWEVLDSAGQLVNYQSSRDKARGEAKMRNAGRWS